MTSRRCRAVAGPGTGDATPNARTLSQPSHSKLNTQRALSYRQAAGRPGDRAAPSVRFARKMRMLGSGQIEILRLGRRRANLTDLIRHRQFSRSRVLTRAGALPTYAPLALTRGECQRSPSRDQ